LNQKIIWRKMVVEVGGYGLVEWWCGVEWGGWLIEWSIIKL
jgi:hypothetical protein